MPNRFEKYLMYRKEDGYMIDVNPDAIKLADEAYLLFKSLFDSNYGSINEDGNLISIHSGGWAYNEELIREFMDTGWWLINHKITASGGHYYFNTDIHAERDWEIMAKQTT
jgi:hypothetical protein